MAEKPEAQSKIQPPSQQTTQAPAHTHPTRQRVLPTIDPAKTINYRQDGVDRSKK